MVRLLSLLPVLAGALLAHAQGDSTLVSAEATSTATATGASSPEPTPYSPPYYPTPETQATGAWAAAVQQARNRVTTWTLEQKVNITTGIQWQKGVCIGNIGAQPDVDFDGLCLQDSPLGVRRTDFNSVFPAGINVASTFDRKLMYERGLAMGKEFKGKGINVALGPGMNPYRAVQAGRNWEGFGPEPFLQGEAAYETIKGLQKNVQATAKHYIANEQERNRTTSSSNLDDRTLREVYLHPFMRSIQADVASVMCSYNQINGTYACENSKLINEILKTDLAFEGYVMSDWQAQMSGVASSLAGLDMSMPGDIVFNSNSSYWGPNLTEAVRNGSVPESRVTDQATRILAAVYLTNQEDNYPAPNFKSWDLQLDPAFNQHVNVQDDHYKLIREIGAASVVILKNDNNTLPLKPSLQTLALIGNQACPPQLGPNGYNNRAGLDGAVSIGWGFHTSSRCIAILSVPLCQTSRADSCPPSRSLLSCLCLPQPLEALQRRARKYSTTVTWTCDNFNRAVINSTSTTSENTESVAMVFIASLSGETNAEFDGNYGDRKNISAWLDGDRLVYDVANHNKNTVVVVNAVGPILMPWIDHPNITAIVWAGLPGQENGNALEQVLYGDVNPSARLPYTIAKYRDDYPVPYIDFLSEPTPAHPQIDYTEGLNLDFRHFQSLGIEPLFPFGAGLSYSTFEYANIAIKDWGVAKRHAEDQKNYRRNNDGEGDDEGQKGEIGRDVAEWLHTTRWSVEFDLTNTGPYPGHEVPLLFLSFPPSAGEPPRVLRGFDRVWLEVGETKRVSFELSYYSLSIWDVVQQKWVKPEGEFKLIVGQTADDTKLEAVI